VRGACGSRVLRSRREFDFERMVFLESANTEHAKTDNTAFFVYAFHHRIAFSRPHVAVRVGKSHFEVIHFRVKPQFQFIAHDIPPASARSQSAPRSRSTTTNPRSCPRLTAIAKMSFFAVAVRIARPPSRWNAALAEDPLGTSSVFGDFESTWMGRAFTKSVYACRSRKRSHGLEKISVHGGKVASGRPRFRDPMRAG